MVIVTQNQYILASKIHHVTMDEQISHNEIYVSGGRRKSVIDRYFQITVIYSPEVNSHNNHNSLSSSSNDIRECSVVIRGNVNAHLVFKNLIQQIREQMPDQLYLDKALENMLNTVDLESLKDKDAQADEEAKAEVKYDRSAKKVRSPRKTKRTSKAVLRKSKKRR